MSKFARVGPIPPDFDVISPTLNALDDEIKRRSGETIQGRSRAEANWLIPQIDWQRTRYVHDMYFKYSRISKECYDYCFRNKIINGKLSEKWLEQGYERLCSLHAIDSRNFQFGGVSICRVPRWKLREDQKDIASPFNGCRGCSSGKGAGAENIFGNKYGQRLAAIQIRREQLQQEEAERIRKENEEEEKQNAIDEADRREKKEKKKKRKKDKEYGTEGSEMAPSTTEGETGTGANPDGKDEPQSPISEKREKKKKKDKEKDKDSKKKEKGSTVWAGNKDEENAALREDDETEKPKTAEEKDRSERTATSDDDNKKQSKRPRVTEEEDS